MNKNIILVIISIITISFNFRVLSQEDSALIENTTEPIEQSDLLQKRKYQYLDNNFREEKSIIKLGILPIDFINRNQDLDPFTSNLNLIFCFEKKLTPSLSIINIEGYKSIDKMAIGYEFLYSDIGLRYYYTMNKRIKDSTGVSNFHGNYFSVKIEEWVKYRTSAYKYSGPEPERFVFDPYLNLSWGIQRRLGKLGFVDIGPSIRFNKTKFEFGINLYIGLGFGFKK
jgi:hypothetical protein